VLREAFLRPADAGSHVQRIALFGSHQRVVNILSQSDIVRHALPVWGVP
jgi:hypothetical protein